MKLNWLRVILVGLSRKVIGLSLKLCSWLATRPAWERRLNLLGLCWAVPELAQKIWATSDDTFYVVLFWTVLVMLVVLPFVARRLRNPMFSAIFAPARRPRALTWRDCERQFRRERVARGRGRWQPEESAFDRFERSVHDGAFEVETFQADSLALETHVEPQAWSRESPDWSREDPAVNPASGLLMVGGIGGVDVAGNPFGVDYDHYHHDTSGYGGLSSPTGWD